MQDAKEAKQRKSGWRGKIHSLRVQVGLMILISYLIPMILLGAFSGILLLRGIQDKTEAAITSGAEHAFAMTKQNVSRAVELARDATYDGELTAAWENGTEEPPETRNICACAAGIWKGNTAGSLCSASPAVFPFPDPKSS